MTPHPTRQNGFTLIELSIVLVIVGLIASGILFGQELIHTAKLRKLVAEQNEINTAIQTFKLKYNCEPGDCPNADLYLGAACGDSSTDGVTGCNGNGDSITYTAEDGQRGEYIKAWMHLSLANLIHGNYSGRGPAGGGGIVMAVAGQNIPISSAITNLAWNYGYCDDASFSYGGSLLNTLCLGGYSATPTIIHNGYKILLMDGLYVDGKIDDGKPLTGKVRGVGEPASGICEVVNDYLNGFPPETPGCSMDFFQ